MTTIQQQNIKQCIVLTQANGVMHYAKSGVLLFTKLLMYGLFVLCLLVTMWLPTDPLHFEEFFGNGNSISTTVHLEAISNAMVTLKVSVLLVGFAFAVMGYILGKIRTKNSILKNVNELLTATNNNTEL